MILSESKIILNLRPENCSWMETIYAARVKTFFRQFEKLIHINETISTLKKGVMSLINRIVEVCESEAMRIEAEEKIKEEEEARRLAEG